MECSFLCLQWGKNVKKKTGDILGCCDCRIVSWGKNGAEDFFLLWKRGLGRFCWSGSGVIYLPGAQVLGSVWDDN